MKLTSDTTVETTLTRERPFTLFNRIFCDLIPILNWEYEIEVTFNYTKASRGSRGTFGIPMESAEPADIEITECYSLLNGEEIELTDREEERIKEYIFEREPSE